MRCLLLLFDWWELKILWICLFLWSLLQMPKSKYKDLQNNVYLLRYATRHGMWHCWECSSNWSICCYVSPAMLYNHVVPCYLRFASSLVFFSRPHSCLDLVEIDLGFCSTSLPLASTRWVHSTFSSHCLLCSKQHRWIISAATTNFSSKNFSGTLGIEPGAAGSKSKYANHCAAHYLS